LAEGEAVKAPIEIQAEIERLVRELNRFGDLHEESCDALIEAQELWEDTYDAFVEDLLSNETKRFPGEDVRLALCRRSTQEARDRWQLYRRAERSVKKCEVQMSRIGKQLSALQSDLKAATVESYT
jgi:hypothetical protein